MSCAARARSARAGLPTIGIRCAVIACRGIGLATRLPNHPVCLAQQTTLTHPQRHYCAISPLNAESLAEKREPTDGRRNLADRLLSLDIAEFQDPAVISVGATP